MAKKPLTNQQKLEKAVALLEEVSAEWNQDTLKYYPDSLPDFDEVIGALSQIQLGN